MSPKTKGSASRAQSYFSDVFALVIGLLGILWLSLSRLAVATCPWESVCGALMFDVTLCELKHMMFVLPKG